MKITSTVHILASSTLETIWAIGVGSVVGHLSTKTHFLVLQKGCFSQMVKKDFSFLKIIRTHIGNNRDHKELSSSTSNTKRTRCDGLTQQSR